MKLTFLVIFLGASSILKAQPGYAINDVTANLPVNKIINSSTIFTNFRQLNDRLLVVDFFGTWCVPCVRALPELSALQGKYKEQLRIVLIANEPEEKLTTFIKKQAEFTLPVVIDTEEVFTKGFQPPSYPYTVIVDKKGKVIAIPLSGEITETNIDRWLKEQNDNAIPTATQITKMNKKELTSGTDISPTEVEPSQNKWVQLSQDFMYAAKTGDQTSGFVAQLRQMTMRELQSAIKTDEEKKAFWINLYNAFTQVALKKDPGQYKKRGRFFGNRQIEIAGHSFSLDDIEHGILRRSKIKWSLGYLSKLFPGKTEKTLRVNSLDYRIHFALNCGAKSCPPIAFYKPENISRQLDLATSAYLKGEASFNESANTLKLPALMSWFRHDFGGRKKMIELVKQLSILPVDKHPVVKFNKYDWTLYLQNYK